MPSDSRPSTTQKIEHLCINGLVDKLLWGLVSIHAARTNQCGYEVDAVMAVDLKTVLDEGLDGKLLLFHKELLVELRKAETGPDVAAVVVLAAALVSSPVQDGGDGQPQRAGRDRRADRAGQGRAGRAARLGRDASHPQQAGQGWHVDRDQGARHEWEARHGWEARTRLEEAYIARSRKMNRIHRKLIKKGINHPFNIDQIKKHRSNTLSTVAHPTARTRVVFNFSLLFKLQVHSPAAGEKFAESF